MPNISQALPFIVCISFLALFAGIIVWMIRSERKRKQEKRERALALGFQPVEPTDPALMDKLFALHARRGRQLELRNLFYHRAVDYDLYLFDLWDTAGEDNSQVVENGVLVVSPHLRLPRMELYSKIEANGFLADAANKVITRLMGEERINFPAEPDFEHHFWVTSPDEAATRAFLRPDLLRRLVSLKNVHLTAGGDAFTLGQAVQGGYVYRSGSSVAQQIAQTIQDAEQVARWFCE